MLTLYSLRPSLHVQTFIPQLRSERNFWENWQIPLLVYNHQSLKWPYIVCNHMVAMYFGCLLANITRSKVNKLANKADMSMQWVKNFTKTLLSSPQKAPLQAIAITLLQKLLIKAMSTKSNEKVADEQKFEQFLTICLNFAGEQQKIGFQLSSQQDHGFVLHMYKPCLNI